MLSPFLVSPFFNNGLFGNSSITFSGAVDYYNIPNILFYIPPNRIALPFAINVIVWPNLAIGDTPDTSIFSKFLYFDTLELILI